MTRQVLYIGNDNLAILAGLKNGISGEWITEATITCTLKNAVGDNVDGAVDVSLTYISPDDIDPDLLAELGQDGNYFGTLEDGLSLTHLATYTAHIYADAGADLIGNWEVPVVARKRSS